jgi:hypothetical protein
VIADAKSPSHHEIVARWAVIARKWVNTRRLSITNPFSGEYRDRFVVIGSSAMAKIRAMR